jgi:3alpha(or 20beta)-hydroxysteroid dehydrogenase
MGRLDGKVVIVTGGASGIGAATSRALVAQGARVVVADVADRQGAALAADVGEHAVFQHLDVTDEAAWCRVVRYTEETFGVLNVLVNGAGVTGPHTLVNHPRQLWEHILEVNLTGPFLGLSTAAEALARSAPASVINVSSYAGLNGVSPSHGYTASKHGLTGLTKSAAREFAPLGIRVNSIHPFRRHAVHRRCCRAGTDDRTQHPATPGSAGGDRRADRLVGQRRIELLHRVPVRRRRRPEYRHVVAVIMAAEALRCPCGDYSRTAAEGELGMELG